MNSQWESFIWESSEVRLVGCGGLVVIGYYHRTLQHLSQLNSLLQTPIWYIVRGDSTQTPSEHYWLCSEMLMPDPLVFWKDSNSENLRQCNKCCQCRDSNPGPLSWEFTVLAPRPSWLDSILGTISCLFSSAISKWKSQFWFNVQLLPAAINIFWGVCC